MLKKNDDGKEYQGIDITDDDWFDYDGDGTLSVYDVNVMCYEKEDYEANKKDCDRMYEYVEEVYGYKT